MNPDPMHDRVQSEQVRTLFEQAPAAVFSHLYFALVVVILLWSRIPTGPLLAWLAVMVLAGAIRLGTSMLYRRRPPPASQWPVWSAIGVALVTLFGLLWGGAAVLFLDPDDPLNVVVIVAIIVGLFSAAAATTASSRWGFYGFIATSYLPMLGVFLAEGSEIGVALIVLGLAAMVTVPLIHRRLNQALEQTLRLGFENEALRREADDANAAKTRFLAAASHDLRQPIHALELSLGVLGERLRDASLQPIVERLEGAVSAVDSMLGSLLDISKLDAGVVVPRPEAIDVERLLRSLETELSPMPAEGANTLHVRPAPGRVVSDPEMLCRILRNLVGNALRYTTGGRVLVAARPRAGRLRIEVRDNGIGIPADRLEDIFKEFHQLGDHQGDRHQGLGLGLAIVRRLAGLLGHPVGVRSRPGQGSCFWIEVPTAGRDAPAAAAAAMDPAGAGHRDPLRGARVLVLDDDPAILQAMQELLQTWGCDVLTLAAIGEAEDAVAAGRPDLLIVDHRLADGQTGLQAAARLQSLADQPIPALVITADTAPDRLREARDSGYQLLHKPVQPARLRSAMQYLLTVTRPEWPPSMGPPSACGTSRFE